MSASGEPGTMSRGLARTITVAIIGLCLLALAMIFQPFVHALYSAGCVMVVIGGLAFNLIPFATTQNKLSRVLRVGGIVIVVLVSAAGFAIGIVELVL